jgi:hypothetical protein
MKKSNFIILMLILLNTSCSNNNSPFYDKVLSNLGKSSYYIALNIRSSSYKGRAVIKNTDLYNFIRKTDPRDTATYVSRIRKILVHGRTLNIGNADPAKWNFHKVKYINSVILNANKGVDSFIAIYFDGVAIRSDLLEDDTDAVINQLFFWHIPVKYDDVSGEVMLGT